MEPGPSGTAWTWLLGPWFTALVRIHGAVGRKRALRAVEELKPRLAEAGVGSLPEVFGAEAPYSSGGCIARAWSVAEVLRAYVEDLQGGETKPARANSRKTSPKG
jgi:glycogen debranching enzyme